MGIWPTERGKEIGSIAVGAPSLGQMIQAKKNRYVITRDADYQSPEGLEDTIIVTAYLELVKKSIIGNFPEYLLKGDAVSGIGPFGRFSIISCQRKGETSGRDRVHQMHLLTCLLCPSGG